MTAVAATASQAARFVQWRRRRLFDRLGFSGGVAVVSALGSFVVVVSASSSSNSSDPPGVLNIRRSLLRYLSPRKAVVAMTTPGEWPSTSDAPADTMMAARIEAE